MKKLSNESGFSALEAILIIVILVMLGGTGYFVWHAKQNADTSLANATKSSDSTTASKANDKVASTTLSKTPSSLQAAVLSHEKTTGCANAQGQYVSEAGEVYDPDTSFISNNSASVGVCSSRSLYAYQNGQWKFLAASQGGYECNLLKQYKIPAALLASNADPKVTCIDVSNNVAAYN